MYHSHVSHVSQSHYKCFIMNSFKYKNEIKSLHYFKLTLERVEVQY